MADSQALDIIRDAFYPAEDHPNHILRHVCPPGLDDQPVEVQEALKSPAVLDDIRNFGIPDEQIKKTARKVFRTLEVNLPAAVAARTTDNNPLHIWVIEWDGDDNGVLSQGAARSYPSTLIRTVQGDFVHAEVGSRSGPHTIHWHGIEPSTMHDGVGKHSFELGSQFDHDEDDEPGPVDGDFIYQFQTNEAGTFLYHCHKNTVLHFEMGMWGLFIVDPKEPEGSDLTAPYFGGQGYVAGRLPSSPAGTELLRYDQEKLWVVDAMDARWHNTGDDQDEEPRHGHNMQGCDPLDPAHVDTFYKYDPNPNTSNRRFNLNNYQPNIFAVSGIFLNYEDTGPKEEDQPPLDPYEGEINNPLIAINANAGQKVLIRYLNAGYTLQEVSLPVAATIIAWDGHALGVDGFHKYSKPYVVPPNTPIRTTTARRFDMIIDTAQTGPFTGFGEIRYYDWVKGKPGGPLAVIRIPVNIA